MFCPDNSKENTHHPWCNFFGKPREGCKLCEKLYREYPVVGESYGEMMAKYFPDVIIRSKPDDRDRVSQN